MKQSNQELFKSALADAKVLQNIALANAKKSLEETFGPKVESMLNNKLAEMEDEMSENTDSKNLDPNNDIMNMEEELDGILKELGMDENQVDENADLEEAEDEDKPAAKPKAKKDDKPAAVKKSTTVALGAGDEEGKEVVDLTVDELSDIIRGIVQDAISGGGEEGMDDLDSFGGDADDLGGDMGGAPEMDDMSAGGEEELDLDELLAELDSDVNESEDVTEGEDLEESSDDINETEEVNEAEWYQKKAAKKMKEAKQAIAEAKQWYSAKGKGKKVKGGPKNQGATGFVKAKTGKTPKINETEENLNEAVRTIRALKETLRDTNLLNAKLLYMNKLFNGKSLNESQKVKVVSAFDKAQSQEEAKTIYNSLNETLTAKKQNIRESIGFASKPTGGIVKKETNLIVEDASVSRMKKLAGIL